MPNKDAFEFALKKGMIRNVGKIQYHQFHWYLLKHRALDDALDARHYGFNARVIPKHGGWSLVVRKR